MFVRNDYLYVCDVNKIVVYHLTQKEEQPQVIMLPEGNLFVNDLAADGNYLYASVTNTDRISVWTSATRPNRESRKSGCR